jgi:hypothetical protein
MRGGDGRDQRHMWAHQLREDCDLARMVHPISSTANSLVRGILARLSGTPV